MDGLVSQTRAQPELPLASRLKASVGQFTNVHDLVKFFRANPQAFALLIICLLLGLGTFLAVMFGLISSGSTTTTGYPEGSITVMHLLAA